MGTISIIIPNDVEKKIREGATLERRSLSNYVTGALILYLKQNTKRKKEAVESEGKEEK